MAPRRTRSPNPQIDDLIARSRQITADLLVVKNETKRVVPARGLRDAQKRVEDRLYLVLNQTHELTDAAREAWRRAAGLEDEQRSAPEDGDTLVISNGQLWLTSGGKR